MRAHTNTHRKKGVLGLCVCVNCEWHNALYTGCACNALKMDPKLGKGPLLVHEFLAKVAVGTLMAEEGLTRGSLGVSEDMREKELRKNWTTWLCLSANMPDPRLGTQDEPDTPNWHVGTVGVACALVLMWARSASVSAEAWKVACHAAASTCGNAHAANFWRRLPQSALTAHDCVLAYRAVTDLLLRWARPETGEHMRHVRSIVSFLRARVAQFLACSFDVRAWGQPALCRLAGPNVAASEQGQPVGVASARFRYAVAAYELEMLRTTYALSKCLPPRRCWTRYELIRKVASPFRRLLGMPLLPLDSAAHDDLAWLGDRLQRIFCHWGDAGMQGVLHVALEAYEDACLLEADAAWYGTMRRLEALQPHAVRMEMRAGLSSDLEEWRLARPQGPPKPMDMVRGTDKGPSHVAWEAAMLALFAQLMGPGEGVSSPAVRVCTLGAHDFVQQQEDAARSDAPLFVRMCGGHALWWRRKMWLQARNIWEVAALWLTIQLRHSRANQPLNKQQEMATDTVEAQLADRQRLLTPMYNAVHPDTFRPAEASRVGVMFTLPFGCPWCGPNPAIDNDEDEQHV